MKTRKAKAKALKRHNQLVEAKARASKAMMMAKTRSNAGKDASDALKKAMKR
jgi:hypothetical protein